MIFIFYAWNINRSFVIFDQVSHVGERWFHKGLGSCFNRCKYIVTSCFWDLVSCLVLIALVSDKGGFVLNFRTKQVDFSFMIIVCDQKLIFPLPWCPPHNGTHIRGGWSVHSQTSSGGFYFIQQNTTRRRKMETTWHQYDNNIDTGLQKEFNNNMTARPQELSNIIFLLSSFFRI